jgi:hypothetical protein
MPIAAYQHSLASPGFVPDLSHGELPPQAWTDGANMMFSRGAPRTITGSMPAYSVTTSIIHNTNIYNATSNYWVVASTSAMYSTDGNTVLDITRLSASTTTIPYTGTADHNWTSAAFGNYLVMNNGADVPQSWLVGAPNALDLTNWPAGWIAQSVRTYRNYLVAMDITIGSDRYPSLVAWSDAAPFDLLPSSWVAATTNDAGDTNLNDTPGWCIDGLTLGGSFIVYKEDSVWAMTYVSGATVMAFRKLFEGVGILSRRCVQEFNGKHFFVGRGDVYVTDGVQLQSVATNRVRKMLFDAISSGSYQRVFTAIDQTRREIWICYPTTGSYPDKALIWNYETDTWYPPRTLAPTAHLSPGIADTAVAVTTFDASAGVAFDDDTGIFDDRNYNPSQTDLLAARPSSTTLDRMNEGTTENSAAITGYLARKLLPFVGQDASGAPALWSPQMKLVRRVWVDATGTGYIYVYLGVHKHESDTPVWFGPFRIDLAQQNFVWTLLRGCFFSIKFETNSAAGDWALTGYKLDWEPVGGF